MSAHFPSAVFKLLFHRVPDCDMPSSIHMHITDINVQILVVLFSLCILRQPHFPSHSFHTLHSFNKASIFIFFAHPYSVY